MNDNDNYRKGVTKNREDRGQSTGTEGAVICRVGVPDVRRGWSCQDPCREREREIRIKKEGKGEGRRQIDRWIDGKKETGG